MEPEPPERSSRPDGLSAADWLGLRAALDADRHRVRGAAGAYRAWSPGQRWNIHFDGEGVSVVPVGQPWCWGLRLASYGFEGQMREVSGRAPVRVDGSRVSYGWGSEIDEWYVNDVRGLEHGYTLHSRPLRVDPGRAARLALALEVRGGLTPRVAADGRGVDFLDAAGATALSYLGLEVFDAAGRSLEAGFGVEDDLLVLRIDEAQALYPVTVDPIARTAYLKASNPDDEDLFGFSVAVSGDTVVVSAPGEDGASGGVDGDQGDNSLLDAGAVYVFVRDGATWVQQAYLKPEVPDLRDDFGTDVAIDGDTIVVGARFEDSNAVGVDGDATNESARDAGAAYVFVRNGTSWTQQAYLKASDTDIGDWFGVAVSVSGDTVVVGASFEDGPFDAIPDAGCAYVFVRDGQTWSQQALLEASLPGVSDYFGNAVSVSGDTLVVGAPGEASTSTGVNGNQNNNGASLSGAAYVFVRSGGVWTQEAYLKASNTGAVDTFGTTLAIDGDTLLVGARLEDGPGTGINPPETGDGSEDSGAVYVFVRDGSTWTQQAYIKAANADAGDRFGRELDLSGDIAVIGAYLEDGAAGPNGGPFSNWIADAGAAYVFVRDGSTWSQTAYLKATYTDNLDYFGYAVGVSGQTVVASTRDDPSTASGVNGSQTDNSGSRVGAAHVFEMQPPECVSFCSAAPNATGERARIYCGGDPASSLVLLSHPVPQTVGQFFYGPSMLAGSPFGDGFLCVGGMTQRVLPQINAGMMMQLPQTAALAISYSAPYAAGLTGTQYFQHWFRSGLATGAGFNTSNGVSVTF